MSSTRARSREAFESIEPLTGRLRREVYFSIYRAGILGRTDLEIEAELDMIGSTVRPRRLELEHQGLIVDSGRTRKTKSGRKATVWIAKENQLRLI